MLLAVLERVPKVSTGYHLPYSPGAFSAQHLTNLCGGVVALHVVTPLKVRFLESVPALVHLIDIGVGEHI